MVWISEVETVAQKDYISESYFDVAARNKLVVKNDDTKVIEETVPAGKTWAVYVRVEINERDAE